MKLLLVMLLLLMVMELLLLLLMVTKPLLMMKQLLMLLLLLMLKPLPLLAADVGSTTDHRSNASAVAAGHCRCSSCYCYFCI